MRVSSLGLERPYVDSWAAGSTLRYPFDTHCTEMPPATRTQSIKSHTTCIYGVTGFKVMLDRWIVQVAFMYQSIDQWEKHQSILHRAIRVSHCNPNRLASRLARQMLCLLFRSSLHSFILRSVHMDASRKKRWMSCRRLKIVP